MKKIYLFVFSLVMFTSAFAQDIHFSQATNAPLWLNPAMTGFFPGVARVGLNYRNQWFSATRSSFFKSPYMTTALNFDMPIQVKNDAVGVGLLLGSDQQGANTFSGFVIQASASYIKTLGKTKNHRLSAGVQVGYTNQSIKTQDFQFANQFVDNQFVSGLNNNENISKSNAGYLNLNAGLFWYGQFKPKLGMYAGAAFYNVTSPKYDILPGQNINYYWRWSVHSGLDIGIGKKFHLLPSGMFTRQGVNDQLNTGLGFGIDFNEKTGLTLGVYNRIHNITKGVTSDAIIPYAGFNVSGFKLGLSYDATVSNLKTAGSGVGGFELYLAYIIAKKDYNFKSALICPRF